MEDEQGERKLFASFEKHDEFVALQEKMLRQCTSKEQDDRDTWTLLRKLSLILDEYQEQAYLLDPYLDQLVNPVVENLKNLVKSPDPNASKDEIGHLTLLLYHYVKFRGYKTISAHCASSNALHTYEYFLLLPDGPAQDPTQWPLRYVMLLWLSLICMLPFDLAQFDEPECLGKTAQDLEEVAKSHLGKAGVEREGAAVMLARLYDRKDMTAKFPAYLQWCAELMDKPTDPIPCIGALHVLSELTKAGSATLIKSNLPALFSLIDRVDEVDVLKNCTLLRKFRVKLSSRILLRLLPARARRSRARALLPSQNDGVNQIEEEDIDVPEETEVVLQDLFKALQDKDTIVRYSSAKAVARIAERLPTEFAEQVLDQVLQLFTIHSMGAASLYDMPSIAEGTWHGACLACAEMARRSLISDSKLGELLDWMKKALYFDIRRGSNSVGSSVRDAASYVLWSIARAQNATALSPFAATLAQTLVTVAVFDREVHIRRAASAAFQEFVGRTNLFPCGIDVLRKTDFYAVGTRRHAFLNAAVEVAEHVEYRPGLLEHLMAVSLRHWDPAMRRLAAQSLCRICQLDLQILGLQCADRIAQYLTFPDSGDIHGALLALSELAAAFGVIAGEDSMIAARRKVKLSHSIVFSWLILVFQIFMYLSTVPSNMVLSRRHEILTAAACELIAKGISPTEANSPVNLASPPWREIVDFGLKSPSVVVQEAAADAMAAASTVLKNIEARRNAYNSMPQILSIVIPGHDACLPSDVVNRMLDSLLAGLEDYTMDERGDVGSWVRIACVKGLATFAETLITNAASIPNFEEYLPSAKYHSLLAGILKQGVERLDNVRQQAGEQFIRLLSLPIPQVHGGEAWRIHGDQLMRQLFLSESETIGWNEGAWLFPEVVQLLDIKEYRRALLKGLVLSASTKTDSTQRPVSASLVSYTANLPVRSTDAPLDLCTLAGDLLADAKANPAINNIVVPILQCFSILLENDVFEEAASDAAGLRRFVPTPTNSRSALEPDIKKYLPDKECAEDRYVDARSKDVGCDTEEAENVILETEWSSSDIASVNEAAQRCAKLLAEAGVKDS
ncbi:hypothetical protein NM688_g5206 [Phlebia brevispora]|uniref:Uncharacterized protein n=1 Tax=Phlebia brevispora TaxID=194682 RepID=A0ACC1SZ46_9APHY|nr:hypothetical protein NM688_g5206 [Phlebia brevispora]